MAGTLLHITLADKAINSALLSESIKSDLVENIDDFRLGSVLFDLPYYDRLWLTALTRILGFDIRYSEIGLFLHSNRATALSLALLNEASSPSDRSFALGSLTHLAVDAVFHTEIERLVAVRTRGDISPDQAHKVIEDEMDYHVHQSLLGHSGIGTSYIRKMFNLHPKSNWAFLVSKTLNKTHEIAQTPAGFLIRLNALRLFGTIYSIPSVPWTKVRFNDSSNLKGLAIDLAQKSIALCAKYMEAGAAYLDGAIKSDAFFASVPERSILA